MLEGGHLMPLLRGRNYDLKPPWPDNILLEHVRPCAIARELVPREVTLNTLPSQPACVAA